MFVDRRVKEQIVSFLWMGFNNLKLFIGQFTRFFQNIFWHFKFANIVQQPAEGSCFDIFFFHMQPVGKNIADKPHVHAMDIGGVIQLPHIMKHVKYIDMLAVWR